MKLNGLHHVTAVTGKAQANVDFYTQVLGMRLVKKTVNQDDVSAYHLFYGDEQGSAGTELTFFEWPHIGPNHPGPGSIAATALRVPGIAALEWWAERLTRYGVTHNGLSEFHGHQQQHLTHLFRYQNGWCRQWHKPPPAVATIPWPDSLASACHAS